jgi:hypothetical protein
MFQADKREAKAYSLSPNDRHSVRWTPDDRKNRSTIGRLRTGHENVNRYLHRIGKRESAECECGEGEQGVKHVLTECRFTEMKRREAEEKQKEIVEEKMLLYMKEGVIEAVAIWEQFVKNRKKHKNELEEEESEMGWRWRDVDM